MERCKKKKKKQKIKPLWEEGGKWREFPPNRLHLLF